MADRDKLDSGFYQPHIRMIVGIATISHFLVILFFLGWLDSNSNWHLLFLLVSLFIFIVLLRPIVANKGISIENGKITFVCRIGLPVTAGIAESLYEVVTRNDEIIRFRFRTEKGRIQVTPHGYRDGERLMEQLRDVIRREKIVIKMIGV